MEVNELYRKLREESIWLKAADGDLQLTGRRDKITPSVVELVRRHKRGLLRLLTVDQSLSTGLVEQAVADSYPVQFIQAGRYAMYRLMHKCKNPNIHSEIDQFNITNVYRYESLDVDNFLKAFREIVARHEVLRTTFFMCGDEPRQRIQTMPPEELIEYMDLAANDRAEERLLEIQKVHKYISFDFERGPLYRAALIRMPHDGYVFLFTLNHIISDAFAVGFMEQEFLTLYQDDQAGRRASLPPVEHQLKDFASWEHALLGGSKGQELRRFWKGVLAGISNFYPLKRLYRPDACVDTTFTSYRADFQQALVANFEQITEADYTSVIGLFHRAVSRRGSMIHFVIDEPLYGALRSVCSRAKCSMFALSSAVLSLVQYLVSGRTDAVVGIHLTNRLAHAALARISGCMSNTAFLRSTVDPLLTVDEYLGGIQNKISASYSNVLYPLEQMLLDHDMSLDAIGSIYVNYIDKNIIHEGGTITDRSRSHEENWGISFYEFDFNIVELEDGLDICCRYRSDLFTHQAAERFVDLFVAVGQAMVSPGHLTLEAILSTPPVIDKQDQLLHGA